RRRSLGPLHDAPGRGRRAPRPRPLRAGPDGGGRVSLARGTARADHPRRACVADRRRSATCGRRRGLHRHRATAARPGHDAGDGRRPRPTRKAPVASPGRAALAPRARRVLHALRRRGPHRLRDRGAGAPLIMLPTGLYEVAVAPCALVLAFLHARRALGGARAAGELLSLTVYGYGLERAAIAAFAAHEYPSSWRVAPGGVPLAVVAVWAAVISAAMAIAVRRGAARPPARAAAAALLALGVDLAMEPVAVRAGLWQWTPPGAWLGVPLGNFVGWAVIVGSYTLGAERWAGSGRLGRETLRRAALAVLSVAALPAVGLLWRGLGAEKM